MKNYLFIFGIILSIWLLTACSQQSLATTAPNSGTALLQVINHSNSPIHSIELSFYQNGFLVSTQGGAYADGSSLKNGDFLDFQLMGHNIDFNQPVTIEARVTINKQNVLVGSIQSVQLTRGNVFNFEIIGSSSRLLFRKL